jgi:hypothetical protein
VEFGFILRSLQRELSEAYENGSPGQIKMSQEDENTGYRVAFVLGLNFIAGEVLALLTIGFRWLNVWTFVVIGLCLLVLIVAVVFVPLVRTSAFD